LGSWSSFSFSPFITFLLSRVRHSPTHFCTFKFVESSLAPRVVYGHLHLLALLSHPCPHFPPLYHSLYLRFYHRMRDFTNPPLFPAAPPPLLFCKYPATPYPQTPLNPGSNPLIPQSCLRCSLEFVTFSPPVLQLTCWNYL